MPGKIAKGSEYRLTLKHQSGCVEWDDVTNKAELPECLVRLVKAVEADVIHYLHTGKKD